MSEDRSLVILLDSFNILLIDRMLNFSYMLMSFSIDRCRRLIHNFSLNFSNFNEITFSSN